MNDIFNQMIIPAISGGGAAYLGAYLRKKAENQALREDFDEIRSQLKTTTRDTEAIRQELANHSWLTQQQWSAREQLYSALLENLHRFMADLLTMLEYYIVPGSEHDRNIEEDSNFRALLTASNKVISEVKNLRGTAAIFLSDKAIESLDQLISDHWQLTTFDAVCTADYVEKAVKLAASTYTEVLAEAKEQLGLSRADHPYSTRD